MMYDSSMIIMALALLNSVILRVSGDYELILSQKDVRVATFSSNVRSTYLENEDNPDANTFTNIGDLNQSDFVDDEGYYRFKLIYTNIHHRNADKSADNNLTQTLEWKQTSWLTATTITGYSAINVPTQTNFDWGERSDFEGLGLSSASQVLLDGDAYGSGNWWNSVGSITAWSGGTPAFDEQVAMTTALYIYKEHSEERNCDILDIDGFLTGCSTEFPSQISIITDSIDDLETDVTTNFTILEADVYANLTILEGRLKALEDESGSASSEIQSLTDELTVVNERIDEFGVSAAKAPSMGLIDNEPNEADGVHVNVKDTLIISLLLFNLIGMICSHYRILSKERRSFNGKKYAVQYDEETDMEPINK